MLASMFSAPKHSRLLSGLSIAAHFSLDQLYICIFINTRAGIRHPLRSLCSRHCRVGRRENMPRAELGSCKCCASVLSRSAVLGCGYITTHPMQDSPRDMEYFSVYLLEVIIDTAAATL